jgi:hypothetical protein
MVAFAWGSAAGGVSVYAVKDTLPFAGVFGVSGASFAHETAISTAAYRNNLLIFIISSING